MRKKILLFWEAWEMLWLNLSPPPRRYEMEEDRYEAKEKRKRRKMSDQEWAEKKRREMGFGGRNVGGDISRQGLEPPPKKRAITNLKEIRPKHRPKFSEKDPYCRLYSVWFLPELEILASLSHIRDLPFRSLDIHYAKRVWKGMEAATARAHKNS